MGSPASPMTQAGQPMGRIARGRDRHDRKIRFGDAWEGEVMSRQARPQRNPAKPVQVPAEGRSGCAAAAALLAGLALVVFGLFVLPLTSRTVLFWRSRGDYLRTQLEVTEIGHG